MLGDGFALDGAAPTSGTASIRFVGESVVVALSGEHDLATVAVVDDAFEAAEAAAAQRLVVDLCGCLFMDSTIVRAVLRARERAIEAQREVVLVHAAGAQPIVDTLLRISGLEHVFGTYRNVDDALDAGRPRTTPGHPRPRAEARMLRRSAR